MVVGIRYATLILPGGTLASGKKLSDRAGREVANVQVQGGFIFSSSCRAAFQGRHRAEFEPPPSAVCC